MARRKRHRKSKKGFELSVTFLVILIISIVLFSSGIFLIRKFFSITGDVEERVAAQTQKEIERRLLEAGEKVSIPQNRKSAKIGDAVTFGLGILNTLGSEHTFAVEMSFNKAYTTKDQELIMQEQGFINSNWIFSSIPDQKLQRNEHIILPLTIRPTGEMSEGLTTARDGIYIFNVCVYKDPADISKSICKKSKPTMPELELLHGNQIKKIYLEIV